MLHVLQVLAGRKNRIENITAFAVREFERAFGPGVSKRDIFHYVYAMLHHPRYRERY